MIETTLRLPSSFLLPPSSFLLPRPLHPYDITRQTRRRTVSSAYVLFWLRFHSSTRVRGKEPGGEFGHSQFIAPVSRVVLRSGCMDTPKLSQYVNFQVGWWGKKSSGCREPFSPPSPRVIQSRWETLICVPASSPTFLAWLFIYSPSCRPHL
jgi:hypothetical protein